MGLFGSSFEDKVRAAVEAVRALGLGVADLNARVEGKVVTLQGTAPSMEVKARVMQEFNARVETDNTLNQIRVAKAEPVVLPRPGGRGDVARRGLRRHSERPGQEVLRQRQPLHEDLRGEQGPAHNPDLIKVGQKLRIPS